jgi:hypothetical protein
LSTQARSSGRELRPRCPRRHDRLAADEFAGFLKNRACAFGDEPVEGAAHGGIGGDAAGGVGTTADGADDEVADTHFRGRRGCELFQCRPNPAVPLGDGLAGATFLLDDDGVRRSAGGADFLEECGAVEAFAPKGDQQRGAHVGMGTKLAYHAVGVGVWIAAGKADQMDLLVPEGEHDFARHVVGALNQIHHRGDVADAFAAVFAEEAFHGVGWKKLCWFSRSKVGR